MCVCKRIRGGMVLLDRQRLNHNFVSHLSCLTHVTVTLNLALLSLSLKGVFCFFVLCCAGIRL